MQDHPAVDCKCHRVFCPVHCICVVALQTQHVLSHGFLLELAVAGQESLPLVRFCTAGESVLDFLSHLTLCCQF